MIGAILCNSLLIQKTVLSSLPGKTILGWLPVTPILTSPDRSSKNSPKLWARIGFVTFTHEIMGTNMRNVGLPVYLVKLIMGQNHIFGTIERVLILEMG